MWSAAFLLLLEEALRDGEDMAVALPYAGVRRQFRRLGHVLDGVTDARLVVVRGAGEPLVVVDEDGYDDDDHDHDHDHDGEEEAGAGGEEGKAGEEGSEEKGEGEEEREGNKEEGKGKQKERAKGKGKGKGEGKKEGRKKYRVVGLSDWSSCVFGDPLLADVFSDPLRPAAPEALWEGFNGGRVARDAEAQDEGKRERERGLPLDRDAVEDFGAAGVRLLLYRVYHAVVHIVRGFYRPRPDSSARELEARRKLSEALARLAEVPDSAKRGHQRRPSGEMSPAKRLKEGV